MIRAARHTLPEDLAQRLTALTKRIDTAEAGKRRVSEAHRLWNLTSTRTRVRGDLYQELASMAAGREQCMYCGETGSTIDHFEPVVRNPLRTFDWLNHLLACFTCNSSKKGGRFPVSTDGQPLLIDPTVEDPLDHLLLALSTGWYVPLTDKGTATAEVCDLNRPLLVQGRLQARSSIEIFLREWESANVAGDGSRAKKAIWTIQGQPFADVCQSMLRQATLPSAAALFDESPGILRILRLDQLRESLLP